MTAQIPKTQKAVVFDTNGGELQYKDIPVPEPQPNELLINVKYSGVCHTDLHAWKGDWPLPTKLPLVGGHEGAGIVVAKGSMVKGWEIGDLAGIKWLNGSCMSCEYCEKANESNCPQADLSGYTHDGSFQQYATADAVQAARVPKGTDLAEVAPILCAGITVYKALKSANLRAGEWVAISGASGGLGSLAVQYAKAMGYRVLGIDGGDERLNCSNNWVVNISSILPNPRMSLQKSSRLLMVVLTVSLMFLSRKAQSLLQLAMQEPTVQLC